MDRSERIGLSVSAAGHVLLFAALSFGLLHWQAEKVMRPPPMEVTLTDRVAMQASSTSHAEPPAAEAPELGQPEPDTTETPPAPVAEPVPAPNPKPVVTPPPKKAPPVEKAQKPEPTKATPAKTQPPKAAPEKAKPRKASRLGDDFLKGLDTPTNSRTPVPPGAGTAPLSPLAARALNTEITRQIKPFWRPPSGADADTLVTLLSVHLDRNGNVVGRPEVIGQNGVTASNRAQATLHAERAIQAVTRASPFTNLPPEYYEQWKWLNPLRFDARLAQ
jgi:outer membrane biosynthesis protein TonB